MGYNTTVVIINDALHEIAADRAFGENLAHAISHGYCEGMDVPAGCHVNAARIVESHHADETVAITVGGNLGIKRAHVRGWRDNESLQMEILQQWASELGYRLVRITS